MKFFLACISPCETKLRIGYYTRTCTHAIRRRQYGDDILTVGVDDRNLLKRNLNPFLNWIPFFAWERERVTTQTLAFLP